MPSHLEEALSLLATAAVRRRTGDYGERAQQLREMAATETDPRLRTHLLMIAAQYYLLAEREASRAQFSGLRPPAMPRVRCP